MKAQDDHLLIAPCGLNCSLCTAYLRDRNKCPGCRIKYQDKSINVPHCKILNCEVNQKERQEFCTDCSAYPCKSMKDLDKRYRTQYHVSNIENLAVIQKDGIPAFLEQEKVKWACPECGGNICVHNGYCYQCKKVIREK